jgi:hypothetical protein
MKISVFIASSLEGYIPSPILKLNKTPFLSYRILWDWFG